MTDTIAIIFVYVRVRDLSLEIRVWEREQAQDRYLASDELACSILKRSVSHPRQRIGSAVATLCPGICDEVLA